MRTLKAIVVNAAIVLLLLLSVNFLSALILSVDRALEIGSGANDGRVDLPVFADRAVASRIFDDFYTGWRGAPYLGSTTEIDDSGRRVVPQPPGAAGPAVHFFGGSTMWGTGTAGSETIPPTSRA